MILLIILITLGLQKYLSTDILPKKTVWLSNYLYVIADFLRRLKLLQGLSGVVLIILPLALIVGIIDYVLQLDWLQPLEFLFELIILLVCLDAHNLRNKLKNYFQAYQQQDYEASYQYGREFINTPVNNIAELIRAITVAILSHATRYIFAILFWYILTGPAGVIVYYSLNLLVLNAAQPTHPFNQLYHSALKLQALLDWLPVRIAGLSYALAGYFMQAFSGYWYVNLIGGLENTQEFAINTGLAALGKEINNGNIAIEENYAALALVNRAIVIWLVVIAIFVLGSWS